MIFRVLAYLLVSFFVHSAGAVEIKSVSEDYPPFEYLENEEVKGFTVDLIEKLYEKTGHTGSAYVLPWARAYKIAQNEPNVLVHRMTRSPEREMQFKWIGKVSDKRVSLFRLKARDDLTLDSLDHAKRYRIGTILDQSSTKFLYSKGFEEGVNTFSVPTQDLNINKLVSGRIEFILAMEPILRYRMSTLGLNFADLQEAIVVDNASEFFMAFSQQTDDKLVEQFRKAFEILIRDGTFAELWQRHFGS